MCKHSQLLLSLLCLLLFACNSTRKLSHEEYVPYKSDVSWQCHEVKRFFYTHTVKLDLPPLAMRLLEESESKVTCEEWEEIKARSEREHEAMKAEAEARRRPYGGTIYCDIGYYSITCR